MSEPKPCPFCGGDPKKELRRLGSTYAASYAVVCDRCRCAGPLKGSKVEAVAVWNSAPRHKEDFADLEPVPDAERETATRRVPSVHMSSLIDEYMSASSVVCDSVPKDHPMRTQLDAAKGATGKMLNEIASQLADRPTLGEVREVLAEVVRSAERDAAAGGYSQARVGLNLLSEAAHAGKPPEVSSNHDSAQISTLGRATLGAKQLWDLLDRIDSLGDEMKPSDLKGYKKFYEISQRIAAKRHDVMTSDGYNLTWTEPTSKGDKEET